RPLKRPGWSASRSPPGQPRATPSLTEEEAERREYARDKPQGVERPAFRTEVLREHFQPALGPRVPHAQFAHTSKCDHCQRVPWHHSPCGTELPTERRYKVSPVEGVAMLFLR